MELEPMDDESDEHEPRFNFNIPEDVMFEVIKEPAGFSIDYAMVVYGDDEFSGAASYDHCYGGFLEYTIEANTGELTREGIFVVEDVTATYHRGDGWETDDDMEFYCGDVRPATIEEILSVWCGGTDFWASEPENIA